MTIRNNYIGVKNPVRKISGFKLSSVAIAIGGFAALVYISLKSYNETDSKSASQFFDPKPDLTKKEIWERLKAIEAAEEDLTKKQLKQYVKTVMKNSR